MGRHVATTQREQAVTMLESGFYTLDEIAEATSMSVRSVQRYRENLRLFGNSQSPHVVTGPRRQIEPQIFDALIELLIQRPDTYLDEAVVFLWDEFRVLVSVQTVSATLREAGWTRKKVRHKACPYSLISLADYCSLVVLLHNATSYSVMPSW